jgi:hypothetical protein
MYPEIDRCRQVSRFPYCLNVCKKVRLVFRWGEGESRGSLRVAREISQLGNDIDQWQAALDELADLLLPMVDAELPTLAGEQRDDDAVLRWFEQHLAETLASVPALGRREFLAGIYQAWEYERRRLRAD